MQASVRVLLVIAGFCAGLKILAGVVGGIMVAGSAVQGVVGLIVVPGALFLGTRVLVRRADLRRKLRSVAVVVGATSCGVGLVAVSWRMVVAIMTDSPVREVDPAPAWVGDCVAVAMCVAAGLFAVLVASEVLDDRPRP